MLMKLLFLDFNINFLIFSTFIHAFKNLYIFWIYNFPLFLLRFRKWNFFTSCLQTLVLFCFSYNPYGFIFLLVFISSYFRFFRCFYCWLHLLNSLFLHCLSSTLFLCFYSECYGFERVLFTLRRFLPSLGPTVLPWRLQASQWG